MNNLINNEILGSIALQEVLRHSQDLTISKCLLILPMAFDKSIRSKLKNKNIKLVSSQDVIISYPEEFSSLAMNFERLLINSINTITLSLELGVAKYEHDKLSIGKIIFDNGAISAIGKLGSDIYDASPNIAKLLTELDSELYFNFRIAP